MVARQTLDLKIGVRIPAPEPGVRILVLFKNI